MKTLLKCLLAVITVTIVFYLIGCFIWDTNDTGKWGQDGRTAMAIMWFLMSAVPCAAIMENEKKY